MRLLIAALLVMATGVVQAQTQTVSARANLSWTLPAQYTDGKAIAAGALTKVQVWATTAPILDTDTSGPTAVLAGTATSYVYSGQVPNGATLYFRIKACTATACGAFGPQVSKSIQIDIPGVPAGMTVTVTVTLSGP